MFSLTGMPCWERKQGENKKRGVVLGIPNSPRKGIWSYEHKRLLKKFPIKLDHPPNATYSR